MPDAYTLVLNRRSATVQAVAERDPEDEMTALLCQQIYDLARMSAKPLEAEEITAFIQRSQKLVAMAAAVAVLVVSIMEIVALYQSAEAFRKIAA